MAKPEWGTKRTCQSCGARFYDFGRQPAVCPVCGATFDVEQLTRARRPRPPARAVAVADEVAGEEVELADTDVEAEDIEEAAELEEEPVEAEEGAEEEDEGLIEDASELGEDEDDMAEVIDQVDPENDR